MGTWDQVPPQGVPHADKMKGGAEGKGHAKLCQLWGGAHSEAVRTGTVNDFAGVTWHGRNKYIKLLPCLSARSSVPDPEGWLQLEIRRDNKRAVKFVFSASPSGRVCV